MKKYLFVVVIGFILLTIEFCGCINNSEKSNDQQEGGLLMEWTKESGMRIDNGVSSATIIADDMFVMYYTAEGIQIAKSSDGLTFEKASVAIENDEPDSLQMMVSNSAIIELTNGSYRMIYEGQDSNHDRRLFSAFSEDGFHWSKEEGVRFQEYGDGKPDELFTSVPDIIRLDNGDLRMYYTRGITSAMALSTDEGITWTKERNLDFDRIVIDPDILLLDDGTYKLFFTSFDSEFGVGSQYVMSASSSDGINFTVDSGKRLEPVSEHMLLLDPDIIRLSDGSYRMYYSEMQNDGSIIILSAISG